MEIDSLINRFNVVFSNISLRNGKVVGMQRYNCGDIIYRIETGVVKYFWEMHETNKSFTIDSDFVLDIHDRASILQYIEECVYDGNCKLIYDTNYENGAIYNFRIVATKNIEIGEEIKIKYDY